jgi:hypothetical protein
VLTNAIAILWALLFAKTDLVAMALVLVRLAGEERGVTVVQRIITLRRKCVQNLPGAIFHAQSFAILLHVVVMVLVPLTVKIVLATLAGVATLATNAKKTGIQHRSAQHSVELI